MSKPEYRPAPGLDEEHDGMEHETFISRRGPAMPHQRQRFGGWRGVLIFIGMSLVITLQLIVVGLLYKQRDQGPSPLRIPEKEYYLTTSRGKMPSTVTRIYHDFDDDFLDHNITNAQRYWKGLFPPGEGMIGLYPNEVEELGVVKSVRGKADPTRHVYLVAAFHQLHCLSVLRKHTIKLWQDPTFSIKDATYYHTMHCVDVLRQHIMCDADSTLIYKREEDQYPGDGGHRTCHNFEALTQWTNEHEYISEIPEIMPGRR